MDSNQGVLGKNLDNNQAVLAKIWIYVAELGQLPKTAGNVVLLVMFRNFSGVKFRHREERRKI